MTRLAAIKKLADGRLCSPGPMQYAVVAGARPATARTRWRSGGAGRARAHHDRAFNAIPGMRCVAPRAAFYAMPCVSLPPGRTDEDYVLALLRATGILCVYGSGFGMPPEPGILPHRVPRRPGRTRVDLRRHRRIHARLSRTRIAAHGR